MMESHAPEGQPEVKMATSIMQTNENMEMNDNDAEIAENNGTAFKHDSLMEYSNMQLDFIKVFGKKVFVMVIGKFQNEVITSDKATNGVNINLVMPAYDISLWDFLKYTSQITKKSGTELFLLKERLEMSRRICDGLFHMNTQYNTAHRDIKIRLVLKLTTTNYGLKGFSKQSISKPLIVIYC